jgi:hypothetical protein
LLRPALLYIRYSGITTTSKGIISTDRINTKKITSRPGKWYLAKAYPAMDENSRLARVVLAETTRLFHMKRWNGWRAKISR